MNIRAKNKTGSWFYQGCDLDPDYYEGYESRNPINDI